MPSDDGMSILLSDDGVVLHVASHGVQRFFDDHGGCLERDSSKGGSEPIHGSSLFVVHVRETEENAQEPGVPEEGQYLGRGFLLWVEVIARKERVDREKERCQLLNHVVGLQKL